MRDLLKDLGITGLVARAVKVSDPSELARLALNGVARLGEGLERLSVEFRANFDQLNDGQAANLARLDAESAASRRELGELIAAVHGVGLHNDHALANLVVLLEERAPELLGSDFRQELEARTQAAMNLTSEAIARQRVESMVEGLGDGGEQATASATEPPADGSDTVH